MFIKNLKNLNVKNLFLISSQSAQQKEKRSSMPRPIKSSAPSSAKQASNPFKKSVIPNPFANAPINKEYRKK